MLGFPEMRLAGLRGLMQIALAQSDRAEALRHARAALAALNPDHRESRFVRVEQALLLRDSAAARGEAAPLTRDAAPTARVCGLVARIAYAEALPDEARAWMGRGGAATHEPDWSDLDPHGRAFAYAPGDWAQLVSTYAETGEPIHPRLERSERMMSELPELPPSYETASSFIGADDSLACAPDDPGLFGDQPYAGGF